MKIKKITKWLLYLCLSPVVIFLFIAAFGGLATGFIYSWATDDDNFLSVFMVAIIGQIAWLCVLLSLHSL